MDNKLFSYQCFTGSQIQQIRIKANCSQREFASLMNVSIGTLRNWEQGRRKPDGAAISLLKIFASNPIEANKSLKSFAGFYEFSEKEKLNIIESLNWDYKIQPEILLESIKDAKSKEAKQLFCKTFQYLHWQDVVRFWGFDICLKMYDPAIKKSILPSLRGKYEFIYRTILKADLSDAGFSASDSAKLFKSILSHRRNSTEQSVC